MARRAVITGFGVLAPGGIGAKAYWSLLAEGRTATRTITRFDASPYRSRMAGEIDFDALACGLAPGQVRDLDRAAQFALVAGREAVTASGLDFDSGDPARVGVALGCAVGCTTSIEREYVAGSLWELGRREGPAAPLYDYVNPSSMAAELARKVGAEGPVTLISTGCTSGIDAVAYAARLIEEGSADVVVSGGTEAPLSPITAVCFDVLQATSMRNDDPAGACRPFDRSRDGLVLAEGSAILIVEEYEHAKARGARIYAELVGFGMSGDAFHMTAPSEGGEGAARCMQSALNDAHVAPTDVQYVNAHGTSTPLGDLGEVMAAKKIFGDHAYKLAMSSTKSTTGHLLGAAGGVEAIFTILALRDQVLPPTINLDEPSEGCDLDFVPHTAREAKLDVAISNSFGFGGTNGTLAFRRA